MLNTDHRHDQPAPPNKPITGKEGEFSVEENGIVNFNNGVYVDNSFAAPGANGCVLKLFGFIPISLNGLVNSQSGLPSAGGQQRDVQNINIELVCRNMRLPVAVRVTPIEKGPGSVPALSMLSTCRGVRRCRAARGAAS